MKLTLLQDKIISIFKSKDTYDLWGFSVIGHREISNILNISSTAAFSSMNNLLKKGVFCDKKSHNRYSDTYFYLKNEREQFDK